ncbi:ATPase family associated with various cellular activities (AAA) [Corynebacterium kalinowskii]|uniref:ATPase family associated with various cellular activities (AAA) n=1 Tax=Corynebacterium kalinowskii TaxID=2675216 RepID=A0A6B8VBH7_9CORY|nr:DUF2075 domain-containing protein [Corynebacterium kalinowskii]QGU01523.1 ATPase family associated with various cellular activities (AAA) [Corynebacterium kalinowskii]
MAKTPLPARRAFVEKISYDAEALKDIEKVTGDLRKYLLEYPTVYVISMREDGGYRVYVGETNSIIQRTKQHLEGDTSARHSRREAWRAFKSADGTELYIIGHSLFNKSLTLDVENRLMQYLPSNAAVKSADENSVFAENARTNAQGEYFTKEHLEESFHQIWNKLHKLDSELFPTEKIIRESALFKASPFHTLTAEQLDAKYEIIESVIEQFKMAEDPRLILVSGAAGTGKTVLLSSLFYDLAQDLPEVEAQLGRTKLNTYLLVNHDEQVKVYEQVAEKLGLSSSKAPRVFKPTSFINNHDPNDPVDVVLIDEAHLLWTQGKQSYRGKNHLKDVLDRAKVVVAVFDPDQILAANQIWEPQELAWMHERANSRIELQMQMRMLASEETTEWIRKFVHEGTIDPIPSDEGYEIRVFDDPSDLHNAISEKASSVEQGLSRLLATYDWKFSSGSKPESGEPWMVQIGDFVLPWNNQQKFVFPRGSVEKDASWAEKPQTINEVGSTFTIQGFDLNYAGVIIGPSVKYRDGKVNFDPASSQNPNVRNKRTLADGSKQSFAELLLQNQLNVLLTRGVHGLYLFATDPELQSRLKEAIR